MMSNSVAAAERTPTGSLRAPENLARNAQQKPGARLVRNPTMFIGLLIVLTYLVLALFGEWLAPNPYTEQHLADGLTTNKAR